MFRFGPNPYFEDRELFKQFKYNKDTGDLLVDQTAIKWKAGHNLCDPRQVGQLIAGKQVRAPSPPKTRMLCVQCPGHACTHVRIHARPLLPLRACHAVMAGSLGKPARAVALNVPSRRVGECHVKRHMPLEATALTCKEGKQRKQQIARPDVRHPLPSGGAA